MTVEKITMPNGSEEYRAVVTGSVRIEQREGSTGLGRMIGHACVFGAWSKLINGWFIEMVQRGAFDEADMSDVVAVLNHDTNQILARTGATLELTVDETGLRYEFDVPDTTAGRDLAENVKLGNIRGSSFRFVVKEDTWEYPQADSMQPEKRTIIKFDRIIDVSPVVYPAYVDTTVAKRSSEAAKGGGDDEARRSLETQVEVEAQARQRKLSLYK